MPAPTLDGPSATRAVQRSEPSILQHRIGDEQLESATTAVVRLTEAPQGLSTAEPPSPAPSIQLRAAPLLGVSRHPALSVPAPSMGSAKPGTGPRTFSRQGASSASVQRLPDFPTDPTDEQAPPRRSGLGAPLVQPAVQPTESIRQSADAVRVLPLQRMFDPGAAAVAAGIAHSDGSGSVLFDPPAGAHPRMPSGAAGPPVQRAAESVPAAESPAPAPAPTGAAAPAAAGTPAPNLDDLAEKLFAPLSARLKAELWLDRERAGFVTDLRH